MKVRYSALALAELDEILTGIAKENPAAARRFAARIEHAVERIAQYPDAAPQIEQRPNVRVVPLVRYPYLIHYSGGDNEIIILRIRHGARRHPWDER